MIPKDWPDGMTSWWLIERGQPEGQKPTVWLDDKMGPGWYGGWTQDVNHARRFEERWEADLFIAGYLTSHKGASARATEHAWLTAAPEGPR